MGNVQRRCPLVIDILSNRLTHRRKSERSESYYPEIWLTGFASVDLTAAPNEVPRFESHVAGDDIQCLGQSEGDQ